MKKQRILFWLILVALGACELVLSWKKPGFSDLYVKYIFPIWGNTYGRLTGLSKMSVGEIMIPLAVVYVVFTIVIWMTRFVNFCDRKEALKSFNRVNTAIFFKLLILVGLIQIQNCFVLYHTTPIFSEATEYEPNREDLIRLREMLANTANELSQTFERDKKGEIVYSSDIPAKAIITMQGLGENAKTRVETGAGSRLDEKLALLSGFYSRPKPLYKSDFFSQQYIEGYYFPFSLEANYNDMMYVANYPDAMCHELSHLKGFILEDEASFLAYLGCISSGDNFFVYSGMLDALSYVEVELKKELALAPDIRESLTPLSDEVKKDMVFLTKEAWDEVHKDALLKTETVKKASDSLIDTTLTLNGVPDGIVSYSRVVDLLLRYYYGGGI